MSLILNSCFIADELFIPPPAEKEKSLQEKTELVITDYLLKNTKFHTYKPFGFSKIIVHKPIEILELEKLEKEKKFNPEADLDSIIQVRKKYIIQNNIERTVEIDHFYTLTDSTGQIATYEYQFTLNDTLGMKSSNPLIMLDIPSEYENVLAYYFYEYTIFMGTSYESSKKLSKDFYQHFKTHLEELDGISVKSTFLWHTLKLCKKVKDTGEFDQQEILEEMVEKYIIDERVDIEKYEPIQFSNLYENLNEEKNSVSSYYFFHKFIGQYENRLDTNVVMVEFSLYYEIGSIYQIERPFDNYFK